MAIAGDVLLRRSSVQMDPVPDDDLRSAATSGVRASTSSVRSWFRATALFIGAIGVVSWAANAAAPFQQLAPGLPGIFRGTATWGDADGDGRLDILLTGNTDDFGRIARIYHGDGDGSFTDTGALFTGVVRGAVAWGDYDRDGDLDLLLTGDTGAGKIARVYRNDGGGKFTDIAAGLQGVFNGSVAWGDYDRDGDLDILLTGSTGTSRISRIYRNDGGKFTDIGAGLMRVDDSAVAWGDLDGDGYPDIVLTGNSDGGRVAFVYHNNQGDGTFTETDPGLTGVDLGAVACADLDGDGDLDILSTGNTATGPVSKIYRNDGGGKFTGLDAGLRGVCQGSVSWGDFDNDGDPDLVVSGNTSNTGAELVTTVYRNDGDGKFTDIQADLPGLRFCGAAWGDHDRDGDLDLLLAGVGQVSWMSTVFRNDGAAKNTPPSIPTALSAKSGAGVTTLTWAAASDDQTPAAGLGYDLRVGTSAGAGDVLSVATTAAGVPLLPGTGNVPSGTKAVLRLPAGRYHASVRSVDPAFAVSAFSADLIFEVGGPTTAPVVTGQRILSGGGFQIEFTGDAPGYSVIAAEDPSLPSTAWTKLGEATVTAPGRWQFTDLGAVVGHVRFYRVFFR